MSTEGKRLRALFDKDHPRIEHWSQVVLPLKIVRVDSTHTYPGGDIHWDILDADDHRLASCSYEENARVIADALNRAP